MPIMVTNTTSMKEQLFEVARSIAQLSKTVEDKDLQIASLMNKLEAHNITDKGGNY